LEAKGMRASSVLISADRKLDPDMQSPWPFDHVIAVLRVGNEEIWMDPSVSVLPFGMLAYPLRGKQALVVPADGAPKLERTPVDPPVSNMFLEDIDGKFSDDGTLEATVRITARGDPEVSLRQAFIGPVESVWPITVQGVIKGVDRTVDKVSDIKVSDPTVTSTPFSLSFRISRAHFIDFSAASGKLQLPLSEIRLPSAEGDGKGEWHRVGLEPVRLGPPGEYAYTARIELPRQIRPNIPADIQIERSYGAYRSSYRLEGEFLVAGRTLVTRKDQLPSAIAEDYVSFRQKVLADLEQNIKVSRTD